MENKKDLVSFIFVNRGGKNLLDAIHNIKDVYSDLNKEIIVIEQADDKPFLRGQLFNIGVKLAHGKYIALSDNDMFHLRKVDWIDIYETFKKPLIGFKYISQVTLKDGLPIITSTKDCPTGFGGFNFMKRIDFINFNGFSNLFVGWGYEDNAYSLRFEYIRVPQNLGHITHPLRNGNNGSKLLYSNVNLYKTAQNRDSKLDGYEQTTFNIESKEIILEDVKYIKVNEISVIDGFVYKDILDKQYQLAK